MEFHETYTENIFDYGEVMHLKFIVVLSVIEELLPFDCHDFSDCFRPQPRLGNQWMEFHET